MENISYEEICRHIGHLYIKSQRDIEALRQALMKSEKEREDALKLLTHGFNGEGEASK